MTLNHRLLFGPLAAAILLVGVVGLALAVPGYDPVRQTVSEIGEAGSPMRIPFAAMLCAVAACLVAFATALSDLSVRKGRSRWPVWLTGLMAVSVAGVGLFAFPHPLHNVFGLSELIGYQAPLAMAFAWRGRPGAERVVVWSAIMAVVVWVAIVANLSTLARDSALFLAMKPVYGLVQRGLFAAWFVWCAGVGLLLRAREP